MATHSTIAVQFEDGTIAQSYCHWDGYIANNGRLLAENYNSLEAAKELVSFGSISSLAERAVPSGPHSYSERESGVTVFYGRDRGEADTTADTYVDYHDYIRHCDGDFNYLFRNGRWECTFLNRIVDVETELKYLK